MNEKERLFGRAEYLKEKILAGDHSDKTLKDMAETLDKLEPLVGQSSVSKVPIRIIEVEPIA